MIPLVLCAVSCPPLSAVQLLCRHLLIYGVGGIIARSGGIKLVDLPLGAIGWT